MASRKRKLLNLDQRVNMVKQHDKHVIAQNNSELLVDASKLQEKLE